MPSRASGTITHFFLLRQKTLFSPVSGCPRPTVSARARPGTPVVLRHKVGDYGASRTLRRLADYTCGSPPDFRRDTKSGCRESNSDYIHPMDTYYHYTTARFWISPLMGIPQVPVYLPAEATRRRRATARD